MEDEAWADCCSEVIGHVGVLSVEEVDVGELGCGGVLGMLRQRGVGWGATIGSKSLKVSVDRGHFLEGVERLFSAWATRFNDNEKVQQIDKSLQVVSVFCFHVNNRKKKHTSSLEVLHEDMKAQAKTELNKKAQSVVILCLGNKVLRDVTEETTAAE
ncbi:hypothetical protein Tco_0783796, partial [Tanacetum coccineum]